METNMGRGELKKTARFFKQQIEFLVISCLVVAESFIKKSVNFLYIYEHVIIIVIIVYIYIYTYIYLCKKHCHILHWVYKNNDSFLSFLSSIFHSKIHKHPTFKMNRDEQEGQKFEAKKFAIISLFLHLDAWMQ